MDKVADGRRSGAFEEVVTVTDTIVIENGVVLDEVIDVEAWVIEGKAVHPRAKGYLVRIDKHKYEFGRAHVTGRDVLTKASKTPPEQYILRQVHKSGAVDKVGLDQVVDLARHGVEKFKTMPKTAQDGQV